MSELGLNNPQSLQYWGSIEGAVRSGANTQGVWDAIRSAQASLGNSAPGIDIRDVSKMRSSAVGVRESARQFGNADGLSPVLGSYMATAPWARDLSDRNTLGMWQVRFEHTFTDNGIERTAWRTTMFQGTLPPTVGDLQDAVDQDAQEMAKGYGFEHVAVANISILAI